MNTELLEQVLLSLAEQFEATGPKYWCSFNPANVTECEQLRECIAELLAEGSVCSDHSAERFQFSRSGYIKHLSRIQALRELKAYGGSISPM